MVQLIRFPHDRARRPQETPLPARADPSARPALPLLAPQSAQAPPLPPRVWKVGKLQEPSDMEREDAVADPE